MQPPQRRSNLPVLALIGVLFGTMVGLVSYSSTIYRLFCAATGYGGTTQRVAAANAKVSDRTVTVRFNTDVAPGMPWRFVPAQSEVTVHLGADTLVFFVAENLSDHPIVGHATFNVTPDKVGIYFKKIQCFCFTEERLGAHQKAEMPVDFFVDPALGKDPGATDVDTITLSYTFFPSANPEHPSDLGRFAGKAPSAEDGRKLFATRCTACHDLDRNKAGPALRHVVGRTAGAVPGYHYSPALSAAHLTWSAENLDKWLSGPAKFVPGAHMPIHVSDPETRRDIIAYLEKLAEEAENPTRRASQPSG